jgi:uncharacterized membrane protein HdeD (DUF308 family)
MVELTHTSRASPETRARLGAERAYWLTATGWASIVLGVAGLAALLMFSPRAVSGCGIVIGAAGVGQLLELGRPLRPGERAVRIAIALMFVGLGAALAALPAETALERLVAVLFAASGLVRMLWSAAWPRLPMLWGVGAGLVGTALGIALAAFAPHWALWAIGGAVALDLAAYGAAAVALAAALRR